VPGAEPGPREPFPVDPQEPGDDEDDEAPEPRGLVVSLLNLLYNFGEIGALN